MAIPPTLLHGSLIFREWSENQHRLGCPLHATSGLVASGIARHQRHGKGLAVDRVVGRTIGKGGMEKTPLPLKIAVEADKDADDPHPISARIANQGCQALGRSRRLSWQQAVPLRTEALLPEASLTTEVLGLAVCAKQRDELKRVARSVATGAE